MIADTYGHAAGDEILIVTMQDPLADMAQKLNDADRAPPVADVCTIATEALYGLDQAHRQRGDADGQQHKRVDDNIAGSAALHGDLQPLDGPALRHQMRKCKNELRGVRHTEYEDRHHPKHPHDGDKTADTFSFFVVQQSQFAGHIPSFLAGIFFLE